MSNYTDEERRAMSDWETAGEICARIIFFTRENPNPKESESLRYWEEVRNVAYTKMPQEVRDKWEKLFKE